MRRCLILFISALVFCVGAVGQEEPAVELEDLAYLEVKQRQVEVIVLPIGCNEPHAYHLPYSTDALAARNLALRVARRANQQGAKVLVLPTMPFGVNTNQAPIPYTLSIRPATLSQLVKDLVDTLEKQGIRKVVILNGHGGNSATLTATLRELFASNRRVFVAQLDAWAVYGEQAKGILEADCCADQGIAPGHADEAETSVALALFPEKVRMDKALKPREASPKLPSLNTRYITAIRPWNYVSDTTGVGDPTKATRAKGEKLVDLFVERVSVFLKELSEAKLTETFPY